MASSPLDTLGARALSRRNFLAATAIGIASATILAGCAADGTPVAATGTRGGTLTYLDPEIPTSAQVQESGTWQTRDLIQNLADRLINRNPKTFELEPWIAESWTTSPDGRDYTFVIREGVTYSDGTPLDVASVKKNLEWQVNGDSANGISANSQFPRAISVTTDVVKREVHVHLDTPYAPFLNVLTSWSSGLVANATIDASHDQQVKYTKLIGSGPFRVSSETYGKQYVLERRADYAWAPASAKNQGESKLDKIVWIPTEDDAVRLGAVKSGQAGILRYVEPKDEIALAKQKFTIVAKTGVGLSNQWFLRTTTPPLDDIRVRQALSHAIDREQILKDIYTSSWTAATSVLSPHTFGYKDVSDAFAYDASAAEKLLSEAGWTGKDSAGYRTKNGTRLHLKTYIDVYDNTGNALFQAVQSQFKQLGIELELNKLDYSSYWAKAFADKEVGFLRVGWPHPDPTVGLVEYYSKAGSDLLGLKGSDATLEKLLADQLTAVDDAQRSSLLQQTQDYLVTEKAYVIPILNDSQVFVVRPGITGFELSDGALPLFSNVSVPS
ncbi:ABC transporter substrate-binding protein [Leifsonia sp. NPDC102414]|jgi:peptide/nickel transport system substrate-binding protein|uniref:ABC transporter substrate-binding protein n=1 Tax=Leifsonia sp. NPDC102414 TaxID=3364124 RepID=UPI0038243DBC